MADSASLTDSYLTLLLSFPHLSANTVLALILLTLMRLIPIMVLAPFFGAKTVPGTVRIMFSVALAAILIPKVLMNAKADLQFTWLFVGCSVKELFLGFILGFFASIPFYIAQSSGALIDHIRGSSSLQVTDPTTQSQTATIGVFYNLILIAVFFLMNGPFLFLNALTQSFQLIPVDSFIASGFFSLKLPLWKTVITLLNHILSLAIQLGAPSLVGILMAEMFLGIANRLAPQVQIVFLGIPLKSWVGIAFLFLAWHFILQQLGKESVNWIRTIEKILRYAKT